MGNRFFCFANLYKRSDSRERTERGSATTYIKVKGEWKYLYRAVDSTGDTLDFMLSAKRDGKAAERFFRQVLRAAHTQAPRVINVDKNAAYPVAVEAMKEDKRLCRKKVIS